MKNDGRVHCVALDATKAFDKVSHHGLFYKMLCKGVPVIFVQLLTYWYYTHLLSAIMWNNALGKCFNVLCVVRQGGVLSSYLFAFYINDN